MAGVAEDHGISFRASPMKAFSIVLLCASLTGFLSLFAFGFIAGDGARYTHVVIVSYIGIPLLGILTLGWIRKLVTLHGIIVLIGPNGILDRRISEKLIPWSAVADISVKQVSWSKSLVVRLHPAFEASWPKNVDAWLFKILNGWSGYGITTQGLKASFEELETAVNKYSAIRREAT